ncbi:MAG: hypothetical protein K5840_01695 [Eubacterium sp.]|nr:hypothetical protein [Eubacterium sp.]
MLNMYKNVTGGFYNSEEAEPVVINSDKLLEERLAQMEADRPPEPEVSDEDVPDDEEVRFLEGVEALVRDDPDYHSEYDEPPVEEEAIDPVEEANVAAQQIIDQANEDAEQIISQARLKADQIIATAKEQGYAEGTEQARAEIEELTREFENNKIAWENEVKIREAGMERDLVDKILAVVDKVFRLSISDDKNMILQMVTDALSGIEGARSFTIKVSPGNVAFMESISDSLRRKVGSGVSIEVTSDPALDEMQCMIETETGLFDCSPLREFDNLVRSIRMLSAE